MIDTHTHLNSSRFKKTRYEVVKAARVAGVEAMIIPGTDLADSALAVELAETHAGVYAAVGIHPHDASEAVGWDELENLLSEDKVVAVGETGLDAHYTGVVTEAQLTSFRKHVQLAIKYRKPLIIHSRQATSELLAALDQEWDAALEHNAVLHCCEADMRLLAYAKKRGWYIGVDGDVTYDDEKALFIANVPLDMLVLETDAPYLLPEPLRQEKKYPNEPANLPIIAKKVAEIKGVSLEEVDRQTTQNAQDLFRIVRFA